MGEIVRFDSWQTNNPVQAFLAIALFRFRLKNSPGLKFHKILGTGKGDSFTLNDANPRHWALLTVWQDNEDISFDRHLLIKFMKKLAHTHRKIVLHPIATRGTWAGATPFITKPMMNDTSQIAVITRARIKLRWWRYFYAQVPPVIMDLQRADGLVERFGIGEAPIGLQGTFSIWRDHQSIKKFAYQTSSHKEVIEKTNTLEWYQEELFARFEIVSDEIVP